MRHCSFAHTPHRKALGRQYGVDPRRHLSHGVQSALSRGSTPHRVAVAGFWIDRHARHKFVQFFKVRAVSATRHVAFAEISPDPKNYILALLPQPCSTPDHRYSGVPRARIQADHWGHW